MSRGAFVALLLLAIAVGAGADQRHWSKEFDSSVRCVHAMTSTATGSLGEDIVGILGKGAMDPVLEMVMAAAVKEEMRTPAQRQQCRSRGYDQNKSDFLSAENDFKIGVACGEMVADGRFNDKVRVLCDPRGERCRAQWTGKSGESMEVNVRTYGEMENLFIRGVVSGFARKLNISIGPETEVHFQDLSAQDLEDVILGKTQWENHAEIVKHLYVIRNENESWADELRYLNILADDTFAGYGNVLFAHTLYTHQDDLNPGVADDFGTLIEKVMKEIVAAIHNTDWIQNEDRDKLINYLKTNEIVMGVPKEYRNLTKLEEMMTHYQEAFRNTTLDGECDLEMLTRTHGLARHQLLYSGGGSVNNGSRYFHQEKSILQKNAYHVGSTIIVFPGYLHVLNDFKRTVGFKYGYVGWLVGHELFHGLGLYVRGRPHLKALAARPAYEGVKKCYEEFYAHSKFCMEPEEHSVVRECPIGKRKADEGFCDVESARVLFRMLQRAIMQKAYRQKRDVSGDDQQQIEEYPLFRWRPPGVSESAVREHLLQAGNAYSEEQWFFIAIQLFACDRGSGRRAERKQLADVHSRYQVRVNQVAQQLSEFSEAFGCQKGDSNYVQRNVCSMYGARPAVAPTPTNGVEYDDESWNSAECDYAAPDSPPADPKTSSSTVHLSVAAILYLVQLLY